MSTKEFIGDRVEKFRTSFAREQLSVLSETEKFFVILEVPLRDYTLAEIVRIVGSNNAHITAFDAMSVSGGKFLLVSLKLDADDVTVLSQTFERFNYDEVRCLMKDAIVTDTHKKRLEKLMYYNVAM